MRTCQKIAIARAVSGLLRSGRRFVGLGPEATVDRGGVRWHLDLREGIDLAIYLFGTFERSTARALRRELHSGDTLVDVGANIGAHALPLAQHVGATGRVVAIEPTSFAYEKLARNLSLNPGLGSRIRMRKYVLLRDAAQSRPTSLCSSWPLDGRAGLHEVYMGQSESLEGARVTTVDQVIEEERLDRVAVIKIDVDGFEPDVVAGATRTLSHLRPVVVLELAPSLYSDDGSRPQEMLDTMHGLGYRLLEIPGCRPVPRNFDELASTVTPGASINALARPPR